MRAPRHTMVDAAAPGRATGSPRVLVAHADVDSRQLITAALTPAAIEVIGQARDGREVVRLAREHQPDVVLLDIGIPGLDGLDALERIAEATDGQARVVVLASPSDHEFAFLALRLGALGFLDEDVDLAVLPRVVRDVADGKAALSRSFTSQLVARLRDLPEAGTGMRPVQSALTPREWEVADLLSLGKGTEEMADAMVLSAETVRTHVKNIMRKLDVHSRAELVEEIEHQRSGQLGRRQAGVSPPTA